MLLLGILAAVAFTSKYEAKCGARHYLNPNLHCDHLLRWSNGEWRWEKLQKGVGAPE